MSSAPTLLLATHAIAAAAAVPLGAVQLARRPRGDARHRFVGRVWVVLMVWVAGSSFFIREIRHGQLSLLHILSVVTLVSLVLAVVRIRRGDARGHGRAMLGSWIGLVSAGVFASAVPSRAIPTFAVSDPVGFLLTLLATATGVVGVLALARLLHPIRRGAGAGAVVQDGR